MSKEELEKLAEIQKMIHTQNIYKIAGASRSLNIWASKVAQLIGALFLVWLLTPEVIVDSQGQRKIRLMSKMVILEVFSEDRAKLLGRIPV